VSDRNRILWDLIVRDKQFNRGMKRARDSTNVLRDGAKKLAGTFAVAFGAREIVQFGKASIDAASEYTESVNAVEVATGTAAREILALGDSAAETFGISMLEVNQAATAFAGFAKKINEGDVAGTFEDILGRASDFASVFDIEVSEALSVFQSSLAGQSKPLRRFGKDTSDSSIKAFALANGIGEVGRELTEGEKIQARYGQLMAETAEVAGDFANTIEEVANQERVASAELEKGKILLGNELMPLQRNWIKLQRSVLIPTLTNVTRGLVSMTDEIGEVGEAFGRSTDAQQSFGDQLRGVGSTIFEVGDAFNKFLNPLVGAYGDAVDEARERQMLFLESMRTVTVDEYGTSLGFARDQLNLFGDSADEAESKLRSMDDLVRIFSGNLFDLQRAIAEADINKLFAGGGGSGQVAEGQDIQDALDLNLKTGGGGVQ